MTQCLLLSRKERRSQNYETAKSLLKVGVYIALDPSHNLLKDLFEKSNRFCLDIIPSLMLSRGFSVDHIVSCGVSNYLEFKAIDDIYAPGVN